MTDQPPDREIANLVQSIHIGQSGTRRSFTYGAYPQEMTGAFIHPSGAVTTLAAIPIVQGHSPSVWAEVDNLTDRVSALEREVAALRGYQEEIIVLRTIDRELAKQEIQAIFKTGRTLYFSDIARELRLDLELVADICQELLDAEAIELGTDAL